MSAFEVASGARTGAEWFSTEDNARVYDICVWLRGWVCGQGSGCAGDVIAYRQLI